MCLEDVSGRLLKAPFFADLLPFYVAFNRDLEILSVGKGVKAVFPGIVGEDLNESFEILRPQITLDWSNIIENCNNVFEIKSLKPVESSDERMDAQFGDNPVMLKLRGQMIFFKEWDCVIYFAMPV